jgi:hypothetical protein
LVKAFEGVADIDRLLYNPSPEGLDYIEYYVVAEIIHVAIKIFGNDHECVVFAEQFVKNKGKIQFLPSNESSRPERDLEAVRQDALLKFRDPSNRDLLLGSTSDLDLLLDTTSDLDLLLDDTSDPDLLLGATSDPEMRATQKKIIVYITCYAGSIKGANARGWADSQCAKRVGSIFGK